ncbi:MAG: DNA repair protein RadA [Bacteroidales bacterium]|nr:DNA repair protein RadA [Bacteroidales bacterium]
MAKLKTIYVCQDCGYTSPKWIGKCNSCGAWNSFQEEVEPQKDNSRKLVSSIDAPKNNFPLPIDEIPKNSIDRFHSGLVEFDRVLGGGIVPGSLILLSGEPGIGKSTLVLQSALSISQKVLYISGEESIQQISLRAERIKDKNKNCLVLSETNLETILHQVNFTQPQIVVIDSIQTLFSERIDSIPGTISQIRECTNAIMQFAKSSQIPFILIGHITKDGTIAGPKILEHIVDVVLQFEGDSKYLYRIVRSLKNRFGSTSEIGIFEMTGIGLKEVLNPSEFLLSDSDEEHSGIAIASIIEGIRPLLVEVQALVSTAAYGTPQRSSNGFDTRRLNMLLAVLEKRFGFKIATKDVFINIAGGIKVSDPALDMAVIAAILSSGFDIAIPRNVCFSGEVSLTGELKFIPKIEQRTSEAAKMGMKTIYLPYSKKNEIVSNNISCISKRNIQLIFKDIFQNKNT